MFEKSKEEYYNLLEYEWIGQWFCETSGGYVAAHRFKAVDDITRQGIVAELIGCRTLANLGKHVLLHTKTLNRFGNCSKTDEKLTMSSLWLIVTRISKP